LEAAVADRVPTLDELRADPALAFDMPPCEARRLLVALAPITEVLRLAAASATAPPHRDGEGHRESPEGETLLTPDQVALALGVEVDAVARLCRSFRRKLGHRTYRYRQCDVDAFVRKRG
jgi:hypothetical protein